MAAAKADKAILKKNGRKLKQLKLIDKKLAKSKRKNEDGFPAHESIKFGEVVDRPPEFKVRPRKAIAEKVSLFLFFLFGPSLKICHPAYQPPLLT